MVRGSVFVLLILNSTAPIFGVARINQTGTIVATLLTPIGSYFERSNQASYIGTSYLLSVCCFTPLYGEISYFYPS